MFNKEYRNFEKLIEQKTEFFVLRVNQQYKLAVHF